MFREETMLVHGEGVGTGNFVHCGVMDAGVHGQFIRKRAMPLFPESEEEMPGSGDAMAQSARAACDGVSRRDASA